MTPNKQNVFTPISAVRDGAAVSRRTIAEGTKAPIANPMSRIPAASLDLESQRARVDEPMLRLFWIGTAIRRHYHVAARLFVRKVHAAVLIGHTASDVAGAHAIQLHRNVANHFVR